MLDHERVASGIDTGRHGPDDIFPVAYVHVRIGDDDELGVHELAQKAPYPEHHSLGVPGILLVHAYQREAIRAALRWQIEVCNLGKLLLQQRHEDFIERDAEHGGLVRRFARIGAVVDGIAAQRDALDREHRKPFDLVVVARVVAKGSFGRRLIAGRVARVGLDETLEHDFRSRRNLQSVRQATNDLRARTAQQSRELVLRERVRYRCDCA